MMRRLPPSTTIVGMIAKVGSSSFEAHRRGVRIGGADPKIRRSLIGATDLALLSTFLCDPVMASCVFCRQFLSLSLREDYGKRSRRERGSFQGGRFLLHRG